MTLFKARTYDVLTDFTQVSVTATFEMLLAVKRDSPFKTLQDLVDFARKNPASSISARSIRAARKICRRTCSSR